MASAVVTPMLGYPTKFGNKQAEAFDWTGPSLYVVGGVTLPASQFGWGGFEGGFGGVSQSGTYWAQIRKSGNGATSSLKVVVMVMATGVEAAAIDLSAEIFALMVFGV